MPLTLAPRGKESTILRITGKDETRRFLQDMGFIVGGKVTIVNEIGGNVILGVKNARVALDRSLAQRIIV
ncbi:MAG: ferrous iron transport protein A [Clostridiales bacterium]|nr:ferrous iron transport protein A [Clostridiales bacterium]